MFLQAVEHSSWRVNWASFVKLMEFSFKLERENNVFYLPRISIVVFGSDPSWWCSYGSGNLYMVSSPCIIVPLRYSYSKTAGTSFTVTVFPVAWFSRKEEVICCNSEKKHGNHMTWYLPGYYCGGVGSWGWSGENSTAGRITALTPTHM